MRMNSALVTGAARGIGLATTHQFVSAGYRVIMTDVDEGELSAAAAILASDQVVTVAADVGGADTAERIQLALPESWEPVSILVNNAAVCPKNADGSALNILEVDIGSWDRVMSVNLKGSMLLCKRFLPSMIQQGWGRIVNVASLAGRSQSIGDPAYMASKAGLIALTRHIASTFGRSGITSNAVAPGRIDTVIGGLAGPEAASAYATRAPVGRIGLPVEVASAISFLASREAAFINGAVLDVNGGIWMG